MTHTVMPPLGCTNTVYGPWWLIRLRRSDYCGAMVTSLSPGPYKASLDKTRSDRLMTIVCGLRHTYLGRSEGPALYGVMACRLFISHRQHLLQQISVKVVRGELFSGSICWWTWFLLRKSPSISSQTHPTVYHSNEEFQRIENIHVTLAVEKRVWNYLPVKTLLQFLSRRGHRFLSGFPESYPCMNPDWSLCWRKLLASSCSPRPILNYK